MTVLAASSMAASSSSARADDTSGDVVVSTQNDNPTGTPVTPGIVWNLRPFAEYCPGTGQDANECAQTVAAAPVGFTINNVSYSANGKQGVMSITNTGQDGNIEFPVSPILGDGEDRIMFPLTVGGTFGYVFGPDYDTDFENNNGSVYYALCRTGATCDIVFGLGAWALGRSFWMQMNYIDAGDVGINVYSPNTVLLNLSDPGPAAPPTVGISVAASGTPGQFILTANAAATSPATIAGYSWDFGGGTATPTNGGSSETVAWTGEAASRTISVTVTDSIGQSTTATATLRPTLTIRQAVTSPDAVRADSPATMQVTVGNDGPATITGVTPHVALGPANIVTVTAPSDPASASIPPGGVQVFSVPINALDSGTATGTIDASGTAAGAEVDAAQQTRTFTIGNPGINID
ncbi:MAG TPA: hypothetical protein VGM78_01885, partial [Ilumatobacteraceae bacterium]